MSNTHPIRLALIGAGVFARDAHIPSIQRLGDIYEIAAIWSRSAESAQKLADKLPGTVDVTTDLDALLKRPDIEAVDVVLPINALPDAVEKALASGKHIVSEKPLAPDTATGRHLLGLPRAAGQVWMVAENWRYEPAFIQAAEVVKSGEIGRLMLCHWTLHSWMSETNKYYQTSWRRADDFPGGFLLDGGIHQIATLRMIVGEIVAVSAFVTQMRSDLPPADTLSASLRFDSGLIGSLTISYAAPALAAPARLYVVGEKGIISTDRSILEITRGDVTQGFATRAHGIEGELAAFAAAIRDGQPHRNTPEEALKDLAVIEALLRSAATGQSVTLEI